MNILFVCSGNAGRSQIAQAVFQSLVGDAVGVESAGVRPHDQLHPMTAPLLSRLGLTAEALSPKGLESLERHRFDVIVTIGEEARHAALPAAPGTQWLHWAIPDPDQIGGGSDAKTWNVTAAEVTRRSRGLADWVSRTHPTERYRREPGIATVLFHPHPLVPKKHLPLLKAAGFSLIELSFFFDTPIYDWESAPAISEITRVCAGEGIDIWSVHPPDRGMLGSSDRSDRRLQEDVLVRTAELACEVGAKAVVFHALLDRTAIAHDHRWEARRRLVESLDAVARRVDELPVTLCLETVPAPQGADARALNNTEIMEEHSLYPPHGPFAIAIDTGHSNIAGNLPLQAERAGRRLCSLHINDNDGRSDQHLVPGDGTVSWSAFWSDLSRANYAGPLMIEVLSGEADPMTVAQRSLEAIDPAIERR